MQRLIKSENMTTITGLIHCDDLRSHCYIKKGKIVTPLEEEVDIFSQTSKKITKWEPKAKLKPYEEISKIYLDIETALIPEVAGKKISSREAARIGSIKLIGLRNERDAEIIINNKSERQMLVEFRDVLEKKKPDILFTFNGVGFDLPYLYERFEHYHIARNPIIISEKTARFGAAKLAGRYRDEFFTPVFIEVEGKRIPHVDLYQLAIAYDSVLRKFNFFSLKSLPIEMGLRDTPRLELSPLEMQQAYDSGDYDRLIQYLKFDLEDTKLLADSLMPSLYYQLMYFPQLNIQQMVTCGNATKWLKLLEGHYGRQYTQSLVRGDTAKFRGAITRAVAGLHKYVAAFDYAGMYPSCMVQYGIFSENDPENVMLGAMSHAVDYRSTIKYKKNPTKLEEDLSTAVKPAINSAYGSLASPIPYGDTIAAAMITYMARARIKWSVAFAENMGGKIVLSDTDSLYITTEKTDIHLKYTLDDDTLALLPKDSHPRLLSAVAIGMELKRNIPGGSLLDFDGVMNILYVPPTTIPSDYDKSYRLGSPNGKRFAYKNLLKVDKEDQNYEIDKELIDKEIMALGHEKITFSLLKYISDKHFLSFPDYEAIKKNYIKLEWKAKKQKFILKAKGRYVKRDRFQLEKDFQMNYVQKLVNSRKDADDYYYQVLSDLYSGNYNIDELKINRVVRIGEVNLIQSGIGRVHERVSYWIGDDEKPTIRGKYNINFYVKKIKKMYEELTCFQPETNCELIEKQVKETRSHQVQMSLF